MTVLDISLAGKSLKASWKPFAALSVGVVLVAMGLGGKAEAATDCGSQSTQHPVSTLCRAHALHAGAGATQAYAPAKTSVAIDSDGARLTPLTAADTSVRNLRAAPAPGLRGALSHAFDAPAPNADAPLAVALDRGPTAARATDARNALDDTMQGSDVATPLYSAAIFSSPVAWSILLAGLLGLVAMARGPAVARVQSWGMIPAQSGLRSRTRASALDRVDPARYAQAPIHRANRGQFVRAAGAGRFGAYV